MRVIAVVAQKGGVGKTTITQSLAVEAVRHDVPTAIIDTDPQHSAAGWGSQRAAAGINAPTVVALGPNRLQAIVSEMQSRGAQLVIIDTPPHSTPAINAALETAHAAVLVTRPNPMDVGTLEVTWQIVTRLKKPAGTVFTQVPPGTRARALSLAQARLDELGIPYCPTPLSYSLSYPYAQAEAYSIQERGPAGKPHAEIAKVWAWCKRLGLI